MSQENCKWSEISVPCSCRNTTNNLNAYFRLFALSSSSNQDKKRMLTVANAVPDKINWKHGSYKRYMDEKVGKLIKCSTALGGCNYNGPLKF